MSHQDAPYGQAAAGELASTTARLARFALDVQLDTLPRDVVDTARLRILDTIGVALAGAGESCTRIALDTARDLGGRPVATVLAHGDRTSSALAALVNGVSAHALNYDDVTLSAETHTSASIVPVVLALGEARGASGKQLLEAYVAGFEVTTRIGWGVVGRLLPRGWHPNGVLAVIGGAVAGARLLGARLDQARAAMGIGASCAAGIRKNIGSMTKPFHMGHAAHDGVLAALLAVRGYTADPAVLETAPNALDASPGDASRGHSHFSFPVTFAGPGSYDLDAVVRGLGEVYALADGSTVTSFHPCASALAGVIDETLELVARHDVRPEQVHRIQVEVTPLCLATAPYGTPTSGLEARFSVPFSVAVAILDRQVGPAQYKVDRVCQADVQALTQRVQVSVAADLTAAARGQTGMATTPIATRVTITLHDGRVYRGARHTTRGFPSYQPTWPDVVGKFSACADGVLGADQVRRTLEMIGELERLPDVRLLSAALVAPAAI